MRLVSDRRTRTAKPVYELPTGRPARVGVFGRGIGSDEHFTCYPMKVASSVTPTTKRRSDEQSAVIKREFAGTVSFALQYWFWLTFDAV